MMRRGTTGIFEKQVSDIARYSSLLPSEVGVWLFREDEDSSGSTIEEIPFDRSEGIEPEEYESVAEALYNRSAALQNQFQELAGAAAREQEVKSLTQSGSRVGEENLSRSHRREGCRVYLDGVPSPRIAVDADLAFPDHSFEGSRCDLVIFLVDTDGKLLTVPAELKAGNVDASEVHGQLQQGANFAVRVALRGMESKLIPVVFYGKRIHPKQLRTLNRLK